MTHSEKAYAKINLFLDVLNKRPDGYHDIGTLFQTISAHDNLSFQVRNTPEIIVTYTIEPNYPPEKDLIYRAALLLQQKYQVAQGALIHLDKNLPEGAGLGGGSADAAATLRGLNKIWGLNLPSAELEALGATLGADVPFLVLGGTALASGIGDEMTRVRPIILPPTAALVVLTPQCAVPTAAAYAAIQPSGAARWQSYLQQIQNLGTERNALDLLLFNKFESTVFETFPDVAEIKNIMVELGAQQALMSGSGSSLFALTPDFALAQTIVDRLQDRIRWSFIGKFA